MNAASDVSTQLLPELSDARIICQSLPYLQCLSHIGEGGLSPRAGVHCAASEFMPSEFQELETPTANPDDPVSKPTATDSVEVKVFYYNRANREVAILCNHQRTVPKAFESQIAKMDEKVFLLTLSVKERF